MININEDEKPKILQDLLNQRYQSEHLMRQRSADFTKWILGLGIGLLWIILSKAQLTMIQKLITSGFVVCFTGGTIYFLWEICRGFINNKKVIIKLESLLGFYKSGAFCNDQAIFLPEYKESQNKKVSSHFKSLYALLIMLCIFLLVVIFTNPASNNDSINISAQNIQVKSNERER